MNLTSLFHQDLDKILAEMGIIISALLISLSVAKMNVNYAVVGVLFTASCITWLIIRENNLSIKIDTLSSNSTVLFFFSSFLILFSLSVFSIFFRSHATHMYSKPLIYFLLILLMVSILFIETISFNNIFVPFVLFQIISLGLLISWSQLLIFPNLVGVDSWYHQNLVLELIDSHFIPKGSNYSNLPLFHLFVASTSLITGFNYKFSVISSISLMQIICNVIFVYVIGKSIFKNHKIGLLSSLLLVVSNYHIHMSYIMIPNSFSALFILPCYYILIKIKAKNLLKGIFISFLTASCIILSHTVTSVCMAVTLFAFYVSLYIWDFIHIGKKAKCFINFPILFSVVMFSWWSFVSGTIYSLSRLISWGFSIDAFQHTPSDFNIGTTINSSIFENIFSTSGEFLFFTLAFIGYFYMISNKYGDKFSFSMANVGITPLALGFFSILTGHSILEQRWWYFSQILLAIPLAVTFIVLINCAKKRVIVPISIVIIFVMFLITSPVANVEHNIFSQKNNLAQIQTLTFSEFQAIRTASDFYDGYLATDNYYALSQSYEYKVKPFDNLMLRDNETQLDNNLLLIRSRTVGKPIMIYTKLIYFEQDILNLLGVSCRHNVYNCGTVQGYL